VTLPPYRFCAEALHSSLLTLDGEYFIPAHHVVSIRISNDDLCAVKVEPQSCFDRYFKDQRDIVIFDQTRKYEIRVPIPTFTAPEWYDLKPLP
jgi:hypothetical protein